MKIFGFVSETFENGTEAAPVSEAFVKQCLQTYLP